MRNAPLFAFMLFTLPLCASLACSASSSETSSSASTAGWTRAISIGYRTEHPHALGEKATLEVSDRLVGPTTCQGSSSSSSGGCSGGGASGQSCSNPSVPVYSTVESVTCVGACVASAKPLGGGVFQVEVVGREAGPANVVVRLRDTAGEIKETSITLGFLRATHLEVVRAIAGSPHGTAYAALPGAAFTWCSSVDADGAKLTYEASNLSVTIDGASTEQTAKAWPSSKDGRCDSFVAGAPGEINVTIAYGDLVRHEQVRVVAPGDVTQVELLELGTKFAGSGDMLPIESDPLRRIRAASTLIELGAADCHDREDSAPIVQRLTVADGTFALGLASALTITPRDLVDLVSHAPGTTLDQAAVARLVTRARGRGTLVSDIGAGHLEIPIEVSGRCLPESSEPADAGNAGADANDTDSSDAGSSEPASPRPGQGDGD